MRHSIVMVVGTLLGLGFMPQPTSAQETERSEFYIKAHSACANYDKTSVLADKVKFCHELRAEFFSLIGQEKYDPATPYERNVLNYALAAFSTTIASMQLKIDGVPTSRWCGEMRNALTYMGRTTPADWPKKQADAVSRQMTELRGQVEKYC